MLIAIISWVLLVDTHHSSFIQIFGTKKWASVPIVPGKSPSSVNHRTTWAIFHSYVKLPQGVLRYLVLGDYELAITNPYEWEACQPYEMGKRGMAQGFVAPCAACPYESMYVLVLLNLIETKYIPCGPNIPLFFFFKSLCFFFFNQTKCKMPIYKHWETVPWRFQPLGASGMTTFNKYLDNPTVRITLFVGGIDEKVTNRAADGPFGSVKR